LHLLRTRPSFSLPGGLLLNFGWYDLTILPSAFILPNAPILSLESMRAFVAAFAPSSQDLKSPAISPLYEDLEVFRGRLPAALFTCGTADPLLDDNILMGARWAMAGAKTINKFYTGACHGFLSMGSDEAQEALRDMMTWIGERIGEGQ
jgi:acetyl esterase/lipase